jgi:hypothetical protein
MQIKDIVQTQELGREELAAVRGGSTFSNSATNVAHAVGGSGIGGAATAVVVAPVTQIDASLKMDTSLQTANAHSVLGHMKDTAKKYC